ncbi:MAG: hypothetical protein EOS00_06905 [Mesorhizobium sp.]|nr:MAG: hypothetical protein EOS00_06905 [Mesorhizobium sp.]
MVWLGFAIGFVGLVCILLAFRAGLRSRLVLVLVGGLVAIGGVSIISGREDLPYELGFAQKPLAFRAIDISEVQLLDLVLVFHENDAPDDFDEFGRPITRIVPNYELSGKIKNLSNYDLKSFRLNVFVLDNCVTPDACDTVGQGQVFVDQMIVPARQLRAFSAIFRFDDMPPGQKIKWRCEPTELEAVLSRQMSAYDLAAPKP